jgi:hypothetical protein
MDKACGTLDLLLIMSRLKMVGAVLPVTSYAFVHCTGTTFIFTIKIKVGVFLHSLLTSLLSGDD